MALTGRSGDAIVPAPREGEKVMSQVCMVTGKRPLTGMNVSHSHVRTKRRLLPNLHTKRYWIPSEKRWVSLRLSAHGMRIIDKLGIEEVLRDVRARGVKV